MASFYLKVPAPELIGLMFIPLLVTLIGICGQKKIAVKVFQRILLLGALAALVLSIMAFHHMYWAGSYNEMDISGEMGALLHQPIGETKLILTLSPFPTLLLLLVSFWVVILFIWQLLQTEAPSYAVLIKQCALWTCLIFLFLSTTTLECVFVFLLGSIVGLWYHPATAKNDELPSTWIFVQHRLGELALATAALLLFLAYNTNESNLWLFRGFQSPYKSFTGGLFEGFYSDQIFRWASCLVIIGVLSRLGAFIGIDRIERHCLAQNPFVRPFYIWFMFGGGLLIIHQTKMLHVNMQWHLAWVFLLLLLYAVFLALRSFLATTLERSDYWLQMSLYVFACAALLPYDNTGGYLLALLFFSAVPLLAITQTSILNSVDNQNKLHLLGGLWKPLRAQERIRFLLAFSMSPLILSATFYSSILWADWAIAPFFRYGFWGILAALSLLLTAAAFKPVFQIFSGPLPAHLKPISPQKRHRHFLGFVTFCTLFITLCPNVIGVPVHRFQKLIQSEYAPLLNWLGPETNTGFALLNQFGYRLGVLASSAEQWHFYGLIWFFAFLGWLVVFLKFRSRNHTATVAPIDEETDALPLSHFDLTGPLNDFIELIVLRVSFFAKRIIQPLLAGGLLWHLWRAPGSLLRFTFWVFHNGDPRRLVSVFFVLISLGLYWWSRHL